MSKKMNSTLMAIVMMLLVSVPALALPDAPPTATLSVNNPNPLTSAVLTAVAVDTLANAGVATIQLYENGNLIDTKNCNGYSSCVMVKTVTHNSGRYVYYSVSRDKSGQSTQSQIRTVTFSGGNQNPVIDSKTPSSSSTQASETSGVDFSVTAHDPDGDSLSYQWFVSLQPVAGQTTRNFHFQPSVTQDTQYTVTVEVYDGKGGETSAGWYATILDEVTSIDLDGTQLLTECEQGTYTVTINTNDQVSTINWDFGDGTSYNGAETETHSFPGDGQYTVTVRVTDSEGQTEIATLSVVVEDSEPTVDIIAPATGTVDEPITFDSDVTAPCHDALVSHAWDFGDGSAPVNGGANVLPVQHTYTESGVYDVTLTVCDEDNCVSDVHTITIDYLGPQADFDYSPADPAEGEEVQFVDQSQTNDPNGLDYAWDFDGDGVIDSTDANPTYTYDEEGDYTVTLTVTDQYGSDSHSVTITVGNNAPTVDFTATPTAGDESLTVDFSCTATGGNAPLDFSINFGDGSPAVHATAATHTYEEDGNYTATCTVMDADGDSDQMTIGIEVYDTVPDADFIWDPTAPTEGDSVGFYSTVTAHDTPVIFSWDLGDGSTAGNVADLTHAYAEEGTYTVTMTVTDSDGSVITVPHDITVSNNAPVADLVADVTSGDEPLTVELICVSIGGNQPILYTLNFGDGSSVLVTPGMPVLHTYMQNGTYDASCIVSDVDGDSDMDVETITVFDTEPTVSFTYDPADPVEQEPIDFTSTISGYDQPLSIEWTFGDGGTSVDPNPTHAFDVDGTYQVTLTVTDADGSVVSVTQSVVVGNNAPDVMIDSNPTYGLEGTIAEITCTWQDGNSPFSWYIEFGDGSAREYNTTTVYHEYQTAGTYTAECVVTDADGDVGQDSIIINIDNNVPMPTLVANPSTGLEPLDVTAVCNTTSGNGPFDYEINWGDGSALLTGDDEAPTFGGSHTYVQDGIYTIQCDVWDADSDHSTATTVVTVLDSEPSASFDYTPMNPTEGDTVDFDATISGYDQPLSIDWDLDGDGLTDSSLEDPSFTYALEGDYNVSLTVTDNDGSRVTVWHIVSVSNNAPFVNLDADPMVGPENTEVTFDCSAVGGNPMLMFTIDFGDGSPVYVGTTTTHVYTAPGSYSAVCTVGDVDGDTDSDTVVINIDNNPPVIGSFTVIPSTTTEGQTVIYDCQSTGGDAPISYLVDLGDGTTTTNPQGTHVYALEGVYTASCNVTDADLDYDYEETVVTVTNNPPIVNLVANTTNGLEPLTVEFTCNVGAGNAPFDYEMDLGDGSPLVYSNTAVHTYPTEGTWQASCTVTDVDGDVGSDTEQIVVMNNPPSINFVVDPTSGVEGMQVDFDCQITGGNDPMVIEVGYGDGATTGATESSHTYPLEGNYTAYCDVTDNDGDHARVEQLIEVLNNPPIVDVQLNTTSGYEPLSVDIFCSVGDGNEPFDYEIDFGDGSAPVASDSATHTYPIPGHYDITCSVTDVDGDFDSDVETVYVIDYPPVITQYLVTPTTAPEGADVYFDCQSTGGNEPITYLIDFGDGTTTTSTSAFHNYALEGIYNTSCLVQDADGDFAIMRQAVNITNNAPVVNLDTNVTMGDEPLSVDFTCLVGAGNQPFSYEIDFGDGSAPVAADTATHTYAAPGAYDASCTVIDVDGDIGSDNQLIVVIDNAPVVNLVATPTTGPEGVSVDYECQVFGGNAPFNYVLDFGDGTSVNQDTATKVYGLEGVYTAICTVTDADLDVGTDTVQINVTNNAPIVNLWTNTTSGSEPLTVEFECQVGNGNTPFSYEIDFGDGSAPVSTDTAVHTYATPGSYDATCTVIDVDGDMGTDLQTLTVADNPPVINFVVTPTTGPEGTTVDFDCQVTGGNTPFITLVSYGDGQSTPALTSSHYYGIEGLFTTSCVVQDADGDTATAFVDVNITNNAPVANLVANVTSGGEPLDVLFTCNVGGGNAPLTYSLDFGDGSAPASTSSAAHTYAIPGAYDAICTVTDTDGDVATSLLTIMVANDAPVVNLVAIPTTGPEGVTVDFDCQSAGGNLPLTFVIAFGDGTFTNSQTASHTYPLEGIYMAMCTVTDADLDVGTDVEEINITNNAPVANLVANVTDGMEPLTVEFNCTVGNGNAPFSYVLDFGDGSALVYSDTAVHTYIADGQYLPTCTVTDVDGDVNVDVRELINVTDSVPTANFTHSTPVVEGAPASFTDLSTAYDGVVVWEWDFESDGTVDSYAQNPVWTFASDGNYLVTLTVTDGDGSQDSYSEIVPVQNNAPTVSLSIVPNQGPEPLTATITCSVSGGNAPFAYLIQYGDGSTTTSASSSKLYDQDGLYGVVCTVTDADGDVGLALQNVNVTDTAPTASFVWTPLNPNNGQQVDFTDTSVPGHDAIVSWAWDFENDGVIDSTAQNPSHVFALGGIYMVNLTVTDADGSVDDSVRSVAVAMTPGAPIIFNVNAIPTFNSVNITWGTDQAADSLVEWGLTSSLGSSEYDSGMVFDHNVELTGLAPSTTYEFNLTSCNSIPECTTVGTFSFTTDPIPDTTPPAPVTGLGANDIGVDWIEWTWNNPADPDYDHADVYINGTFYVRVDEPDNTVNVSGLSPDTVYIVTVVAVDNSSNEALPGVSDIETTLSGADITPPGPVFGLAESDVGDTWIEWSWTNPVDLDFDYVEVWIDGVYVTSVTGTSVNVTGLASGTSHQIGLITVDTTGNRNIPAETDWATTTSTGDTIAPTVVLQTPGDGSTDTDGDVSVGYTVTDNMAMIMVCDVFSNTTGVWQSEWSGNILGGFPATYSFTGLGDGTYSWNVQCSDGINTAFAPLNFSFTVDTSIPDVTAPTVTLLAPLDGSGDADGDVTVQFTVSDDMASSLTCTVYSNATGAWSPDNVQAVLNGGMGSFSYTGLGDADYEWNVECNDGTNTDSAAANWAFTVDTSGSGFAHDIAVLQINYTGEGSTIWLDDVLEVNATVENQGTNAETFNLHLEIDGVVMATQVVSLGAGATSVETFNWPAAPKDYRTVVVRAQPVAGETDLADQSAIKIVSVISADDVVDPSTRYAVYWAGVLYVPVLNAYNDRSFDGLKVSVSSATAIITPPLTQTVSLGPSQTVIPMWNVAAMPGDIITVTEGNGEIVFTTTA